MKRKWGYTAILFAAMHTIPLTADTSGIENSVLFNQLSLAAAIQAAQVSISHCRKEGHHVSATVVDRFGQSQVMLRDTEASPISAELSHKKAYTAANFNKNTKQLANLSNTAIGRTEGVLMSAGGVLIKVDDTIYGAVGVSGAETGAIDDACAMEGASIIVEALKAEKKKPEVKAKLNAEKISKSVNRNNQQDTH